jgi:hypothetical protein
MAEMCKAYNIQVPTFYKRVHVLGWTVKDALTTPVHDHVVVDHEGNEYSSEKEMCCTWGVSLSAFRRKIKEGWDIKDALTVLETPYGRPCKDYSGKEYRSVSEMCRANGISTSAYNHRIERGASIEEALKSDVQKKEYVHYDHLGEQYSSLKEMCDKYKITPGIWDNRRRAGWSVKDALTTPARSTAVYDHRNIEYPSIVQMCESYGITKAAYYTRLKNGWDLQRILTTPLNPHYDEAVDHHGNKFRCKIDMIRYYNKTITRKAYDSRLELGWSVEEALTIPRNMYIGEYRVAECLKRLNVTFYHDCSVKKIFKDLNVDIDWEDFLNELHENLAKAGIQWSKEKIEKLRPDFVLYTDNDKKIRGVIEFDGEQHQNFVEFFFRTVEEFTRRHHADMAKQSLWEYLGVPMLRIRYDQVSKIDDMVQAFVTHPQDYIIRHNTYLSEDEYWSVLREEKARIDLAFAG